MNKDLNHLILIMTSPEFEMMFDRETTAPTMLKQDFIDLRDEYCMDLISTRGFVNNDQPDNITDIDVSFMVEDFAKYCYRCGWEIEGYSRIGETL
jgi:hypothetical protein